MVKEPEVWSPLKQKHAVCRDFEAGHYIAHSYILLLRLLWYYPHICVSVFQVLPLQEVFVPNLCLCFFYPLSKQYTVHGNPRWFNYLNNTDYENIWKLQWALGCSIGQQVKSCVRNCTVTLSGNISAPSSGGTVCLTLLWIPLSWQLFSRFCAVSEWNNLYLIFLWCTTTLAGGALVCNRHKHIVCRRNGISSIAFAGYKPRPYTPYPFNRTPPPPVRKS